MSSAGSSGEGSAGAARTETVLLGGRVLLPDGGPAVGAVVVSSAGGLAEVREDGSYVLEARVAPGVRALQITAVSSTPQGSSSAQRELRGFGSTGVNPVGALHLTSGSACTPNWLPTFGGTPGVNGMVWAQTVFDDGSGPALYIGGSFTSAAGQVVANGVARWDGSAWSALGSGVGGVATPTVRALAVYDDGSGEALYAGGNFTIAGDQPASRIAKWDGLAWSPLGAGVGDAGTLVLALAVYDPGEGVGPLLHVGGSFATAGGQAASGLATWDGGTWSPVASELSGGSGTVHALAVFDDGSGAALYAGGGFTHAGGQLARGVARWDGSNWSPLGSGVEGGPFPLQPAVVHALAEFDDGAGAALYAGGNFSIAGGLPANRIAKWSGGTWSTLGSGVSGGSTTSVLSLVVFDDGAGGALHAAGDFATAGGLPASNVAKWDGGAWSPLGSGVSGTDFPTGRALAVYDSGSGPALYLGGQFTTAGGQPALHIAKWSGSAWSAFGNGLSDGTATSVSALEVFDDGSGPALYVGGKFTSAGAQTLNRIGRWDGQGWSPLGSGLNDRVNALAVFDDGSGAALYAAGWFTSAGGQPANHIAKWDGSVWSPLGSGVSLPMFESHLEALAVFDDGSGPALYAGGHFTSAGEQPIGYLARWNGSTWSSLGVGVEWTVLSLAVFDDGSGPALFVGGAFLTAGGQGASRIAKWNGSAWSSLGSGVSGTGFPGVFALAGFDDGSGPALYVGGAFSSAGGQPASYIAKWDGSGWSPLGSGANNTVLAIRPYDDGSGEALYVGGHFSSIGGLGTSRIARWDGSAWSALGSGVSAGSVFALAAFDAGSGPALHVAGSFDVSPAGDSYITRWACEPPPSLGVAYCFGDGTQTLCPCGNVGGAGQGCANSTSQGALLDATGSLSAGAANLILTGSNLVPGQPGLFFQGTARVNGGAGITFGDGLRCAGEEVVRLEIVLASAAGTSSTSVDIAAKGGVSPGATRTYQLWYRDAFATPCGTGSNLTHGLELVWRP